METPRRSPARAILIAGLVIGTLDALDAILVFGLLRGVTPGRIFQGIAAGWLGRASLAGGAATIALGVATHYLNATIIAAVYYLVSRRIPALRQRFWLWGPLYGWSVYLVMNFVVIPLSAIGVARFSVLGVTNGLLIHALGVGIPAAWFARDPG